MNDEVKKVLRQLFVLVRERMISPDTAVEAVAMTMRGEVIPLVINGESVSLGVPGSADGAK